MQLFQSLFPNLVDKLPEFYDSFVQTLFMTGFSGIISLVLGLFIGITLTVTKKGGILENAVLSSVLDKTVNIFRTIPFIILLALLIPLTRMIAGTAIGTKGAIVPLIFGTVPFFARQVETALAELDKGLIEAALSMGSSPIEIIRRVYLKESLPGLIRAVTITAISLIGLTAMAGAVGGGGLGDFAIRYGHQRNQTDVTLATVIVLILLVSFLQSLSNWIISKISH
ncbi:methionine ABC transporter permease [Gudongella oleilytica]|jgi:D-methionine transport system permease protein|uniref:methionine ABC transporter permease n=1 Tax=Gudongella oleilytica TaxID=1582259 RepID=UPI002A35F61D|nr:methionine ABC transporter permease [Gudongella oleilytica]MDY0257134.1 methionine ABC transporter permease [Gudongella oleilytica]